MNPPSTFSPLGLNPKILDILTKAGFTEPTPIQEKSIPIVLEGKDMIGIAQTGTGKTFAFGLPMLQNANTTNLKLIVVPTRELALQVGEALRRLAIPLNIRIAVVIGGEPIWRQVQFLRNHPHIVVGTPGRIIDHMEQKNLRLDRVNMLVLDEADRILDMGFAPQLKRILMALPKERQTLLFSATMPAEIIGLARNYMRLPVQVEIARQGTPAAKISQEIYFVHRHDKLKLLEKLLEKHSGQILLFSRTKHGARKLTMHIRILNHQAAEIHSNRSLSQRREALEGFKRGKYRILVATDIAARGIDVKNIAVVINYDLPENPEDYVHRIGRTGRAEKTGHAISFATPEQKRDIERIERLIRATLPVGSHPEVPTATPLSSSSAPRGRGGRPFRGGRPSFGSGGGRSFKPRGFAGHRGGHGSRSGQSAPSSQSGQSGYSGHSSRPGYSPRPRPSRKPGERRSRY